MVGVCVVLLFLPVLIFYVIFILGDGCMHPPRSVWSSLTVVLLMPVLCSIGGNLVRWIRRSKLAMKPRRHVNPFIDSRSGQAMHWVEPSEYTSQ